MGLEMSKISGERGPKPCVFSAFSKLDAWNSVEGLFELIDHVSSQCLFRCLVASHVQIEHRGYAAFVASKVHQEARPHLNTLKSPSLTLPLPTKSAFFSTNAPLTCSPSLSATFSFATSSASSSTSTALLILSTSSRAASI